MKGSSLRGESGPCLRQSILLYGSQFSCFFSFFSLPTPPPRTSPWLPPPTCSPPCRRSPPAFNGKPESPSRSFTAPPAICFSRSRTARPSMSFSRRTLSTRRNWKPPASANPAAITHTRAAKSSSGCPTARNSISAPDCGPCLTPPSNGSPSPTRSTLPTAGPPSPPCRNKTSTKGSKTSSCSAKTFRRPRRSWFPAPPTPASSPFVFHVGGECQREGDDAGVGGADYPPIEQACIILKSSRQKET